MKAYNDQASEESSVGEEISPIDSHSIRYLQMSSQPKFLRSSISQTDTIANIVNIENNRILKLREGVESMPSSLNFLSPPLNNAGAIIPKMNMDTKMSALSNSIDFFNKGIIYASTGAISTLDLPLNSGCKLLKHIQSKNCSVKSDTDMPVSEPCIYQSVKLKKSSSSLSKEDLYLFTESSIPRRRDESNALSFFTEDKDDINNIARQLNHFNNT